MFIICNPKLKLQRKLARNRKPKKCYCECTVLPSSFHDLMMYLKNIETTNISQRLVSIPKIPHTTIYILWRHAMFLPLKLIRLKSIECLGSQHFSWSCYELSPCECLDSQHIILILLLTQPLAFNIKLAHLYIGHPHKVGTPQPTLKYVDIYIIWW